MKEKKKLTLDKEIITSLSMREMDNLYGGFILSQAPDCASIPELCTTRVPDCNTFGQCIKNTEYAMCESKECIPVTYGCTEPPQKDTLQCTGNGCISEQGSCVTCDINCNQVTKGCGTNMCMETDICLG